MHTLSSCAFVSIIYCSRFQNFNFVTLVLSIPFIYRLFSVTLENMVQKCIYLVLYHFLLVMFFWSYCQTIFTEVQTVPDKVSALTSVLLIISSLSSWISYYHNKVSSIFVSLCISTQELYLWVSRISSYIAVSEIHGCV